MAIADSSALALLSIEAPGDLLSAPNWGHLFSCFCGGFLCFLCGGFLPPLKISRTVTNCSKAKWSEGWIAKVQGGPDDVSQDYHANGNPDPWIGSERVMVVFYIMEVQPMVATGVHIGTVG